MPSDVTMPYDVPHPVSPGLWALAFGNGTASQPTGALFYTAGPNNQVDGVFGRVDVVTSTMPPPCTGYGC